MVDDQDRLTSYGGSGTSATYQYTAHGDLRRKIVGTDTTEYTYDALGNLTRVELPNGTAIGYLLDAMNRRIGKTVNDTLVKAWLYQGQLTPVAELDGSGNVVSRFVYATGVNVPDYLVRGDSTYRLIRDHLGSVRLVVNVASGTVAQRVSYDEFGIETENTNPGWQPFGYAGGLTDPQTGLVRFGARDYDPVAGRWTAKDPIGFAGGPTGLYEYADSDPVNVVDLFGLFSLRDAASFLPVVGSALDALDAVRCGNYGMAALNLGLAAMDATGMGAIAKGLAVGTMKWSARQSIKQVRGSSSSWAQLRRGLQKIGEVARNSGASPRRDWLTTDHIFFKQKDNWPNSLLNHPANLQTGVPQWLNSAFVHMTPLERAAHLPAWMKVGAGGVASSAAGATVVGCGCN